MSNARGTNGPTSGCPYGSVDRGLWQINSCYHAEVSDSCAYDAACNARAAYAISAGGTNWSPWATYNSGSYRLYLSAASAAVEQVYGSPPAPAPLPAWPILRYGLTSRSVVTLQYLLNAHGALLPPTGYFGPLTYAATRSFQQAHGLIVDGVVGSQTWPVVVVTVAYGSVGDAVRALQAQLIAHGAVGLPVTGYFGPLTQAALISFQRSHGLAASGIADARTWQTLVA